MAREALAVQNVQATGLDPVYTAAVVDGHKFDNDGATIIHVKNGGAAQITVTVQTPFTKNGLDLADQTVDIPVGEERFVGPFSRAVYNQPPGVDQGMTYVDYSDITSVTIAALKV